jgi:hypothetical protein
VRQGEGGRGVHCALHYLTNPRFGCDAAVGDIRKRGGKLGVGGVLFGMLVYGMWRLWEIGKVGRLKR